MIPPCLESYAVFATSTAILGSATLPVSTAITAFQSVGYQLARNRLNADSAGVHLIRVGGGVASFLAHRTWGSLILHGKP